MKAQTIKYWSTLISVLLFVMHASSIQLIAMQRDSQRELNEGKLKFAEGKYNEAIDALNSALSNKLSDVDKIEALLYLGVCWIALNSVENATNQFIEILKISPEYSLEIGKFPPEINNLFDKAKDQFPIIYNLSATPAVFYPYRNNKCSFVFNLTAADCIGLNINANKRTIVTQRKCFKSKGLNNYLWDWKDELINYKQLAIILTPDKINNEHSYNNILKLEVEIPNKLLFRNNEFQLEGHDYLPESMIIRSYPNLILYSGIGILFGLGAYYFFTEKPDQKSDIYAYNQGINTKTHNIVYGIFCCGISITSLIHAFMPKKEIISLRENINKNRELKKEIQNIKESIKVKQEILY